MQINNVEIQKINNTKDLIMSISQLSNEKLETFFTQTIIDTLYIKKIINDPHNLLLVLKDLSSERQTIVCKSLKTYFPTIIKNYYHFNEVLKDLSLEQCAIVCESFKTHFPTIINNYYHFNQVLKNLSLEQCAIVCESLKTHFPTIIKDYYFVYSVLQNLSSEKCMIVCESLKIHFPTIIKNSFEFNIVLQYLSSAQLTIVCESFKTYLPQIIKDAYDFNTVLRYLSSEQLTIVCDFFKTHFPTIIENVYDFNIVLRNLSSEHCAIVCESLKTYLPQIIENIAIFFMTRTDSKENNEKILPYLMEAIGNKSAKDQQQFLCNTNTFHELFRRYLGCNKYSTEVQKCLFLSECRYQLARLDEEEIILSNCNKIEDSQAVKQLSASIRKALGKDDFFTKCKDAIKIASPTLDSYFVLKNIVLALLCGVIFYILAVVIKNNITQTNNPYCLFHTKIGYIMNEIKDSVTKYNLLP